MTPVWCGRDIDDIIFRSIDQQPGEKRDAAQMAPDNLGFNYAREQFFIVVAFVVDQIEGLVAFTLE